MKKRNAVITIQGSIVKIPCFNDDELDYYYRYLRTKGRIFTIHYFNNVDEVTKFMEE